MTSRPPNWSPDGTLSPTRNVRPLKPTYPQGQRPPLDPATANQAFKNFPHQNGANGASSTTVVTTVKQSGGGGIAGNLGGDVTGPASANSVQAILGVPLVGTLANNQVWVVNGSTFTPAYLPGADGTTITISATGVMSVGAVAESQVTGLTADLASKVPTSTAVNTTAPLAGGGGLTGSLTLSVNGATTSSAGVIELAGDLAGGTSTSPKVTGLQGVAFTASAPVNGQGPVYNGTEYVLCVRNVLRSCRAVAVSNIATRSGPVTIDGQSITSTDNNNYVLLTAQTTASQNGLWLVQSGAWTRPNDYPSGQVVKSGAWLLVEAGSTYAGTIWYLNGASDITVDATSTAWSSISVDGFSNPMTAAGDTIIGGAAGAPQRLGVGASGQVLTVVSGAPAWAPSSGSSSGLTWSGTPIR